MKKTELKPDTVKRMAYGREIEVLRACGLPQVMIEHPRREHACPKCGGKTRARLVDVEKGALYCSHCFRGKEDGNRGDLISSVQWLTNSTFPDALAIIAECSGEDVED